MKRVNTNKPVLLAPTPGRAELLLHRISSAGRHDEFILRHNKSMRLVKANTNLLNLDQSFTEKSPKPAQNCLR